MRAYKMVSWETGYHKKFLSKTEAGRTAEQLSYAYGRKPGMAHLCPGRQGVYPGCVRYILKNSYLIPILLVILFIGN